MSLLGIMAALSFFAGACAFIVDYSRVRARGPEE